MTAGRRPVWATALVMIGLLALPLGCGESREGSTTMMFRSLSLPSDVTVREFPQNENGKRWELERTTRRINRSHLGVPKECRERPSMFDSTLYVSYACPDPSTAGAVCLVDLFPTRASQGADGAGVDLVIKCGAPPGSTLPLGSTAPSTSTTASPAPTPAPTPAPAPASTPTSAPTTAPTPAPAR